MATSTPTRTDDAAPPLATATLLASLNVLADLDAALRKASDQIARAARVGLVSPEQGERLLSALDYLVSMQELLRVEHARQVAQLAPASPRRES